MKYPAFFFGIFIIPEKKWLEVVILKETYIYIGAWKGVINAKMFRCVALITVS